MSTTVDDQTTSTVVDSSTSAPKSPTTSAVELESDLDEIALDYFGQLALREAGGEHAEPSSPAERYGWYLQVADEASTAFFGSQPLPSMEVKGSTVEFTLESQTNVYDNIETSSDGVRTFTVDGNRLEDRLTTSGSVEAGPLSAEPGVMYFTALDALVSALVITNNSEETVNVNTWSAEFVNSQDRQVAVEDAAGPDELRPGASASFLWVWPGDDPVGTIYLEGFSTDFTQSFELKMDFAPIG